MRKRIYFLTVFILLLTAKFSPAQVNARMLRNPDVSATHICFVYAGDIWVVEKQGGVAHRLSSPKGEESFPRFSPDGSRIAFSGNYDGNTDIYILPTLGGEVKRLTHHGMPDRLIDWYPDGKNLLYASGRESGRQRYSQFYRISVKGGLPEKLPVPYGEFAAFSPDGKTVAYMPKSRDFRTWKRYRGGTAPDIWLFNLKTFTSKNITDSPANDAQPMWHKKTIYYLSDSGPNMRNNIWAYDIKSGKKRQITKFKDMDIHFPAIGPEDIIFEAGGQIYLLNLTSEKTHKVNIKVVTDESTLKPHVANISRLIRNAGISPHGKRALFEARGEIFSLPAEHGVIRNLSNSSASAERYPAWSPDGKLAAFWSDRSGEYELTVCNARDGSEVKTLTSYGPGYRYNLYWSPDSKKIVFIDKSMTIFVYDIEKNRTTKVDKGLWMYQGNLQNFKVSWSADSRWIAYSRGKENRHEAIFLFNTETNALRQVTSGFYNDSQPVFDPDGKYIYFLSNRTFQPIYGDVDNSFVYANTTNIVAVALRSDVPSPLAPRNDEEEISEKKKETEKDKKEQGKNKDEKKKKKEEVKPVKIVVPGFEKRLTVLPPKAGNYGNLAAVSGKILYQRAPRNGSGDKKSPLLYFDLKKREEKTILDDVDGYQISADHKKLLVNKGLNFAIVAVSSGQKTDKKLPTKEIEMRVDPRAEWQEIFTDAWRLCRDFFYDPNMHGIDWKAMRKQYGKLLQDAVTRWDVNYVIGELIAELSSSHTYRGGGDLESAKRTNVGYLGINWEIHEGAYRIGKIIEGASWDSEVRSPLAAPDLKVKEGDYILAVNGTPLNIAEDPWVAFQDLAGKTIELTVNTLPEMNGARKIIVKTLRSETRLRHLAWIEKNRRRIEKKTNGRVGYIYVRDTGVNGQNELVRQYSAQIDKDALIIDERFNSGGQIPDRFIELLNRPALAFWAVRDGKDWPWPPFGQFGPKVMLINGWSGSGGDAFPDFFRKAGLGPLIGTRTWGGLIGISGAPQLIDGGVVTVPTFRMYDPDGKWFKEGHGVDPDINVPENPTLLAKGIDPQIERAIDEIMKLLQEKPPAKPKRPAYEDRRAKSLK